MRDTLRYVSSARECAIDVPWSGPACIICLQPRQLTREHVIPAALGGRLTARFLCKDCNSRLGHAHEGDVKRDPVVRRLAAKLHADIPHLSQRLEAGQTYVTLGPGVPAKGKLRDGQFVVHATKLPDGSLIQATSVAAKSIRKMLARDGLSKTEIAVALQRFDDAPENTRVGLSANTEIIKWSVTGLTPSLEGPLLNLLVPMKSAYEFLALHAGPAIYQQTPTLQGIRNALCGGTVPPPDVEVERMHAPDAKPFHGLIFEGNSPYAKVQVRLFGQLAFRVHFRRLSVSGPRAMYTHDLTSNEEHIRQLPQIDA